MSVDVSRFWPHSTFDPVFMAVWILSSLPCRYDVWWRLAMQILLYTPTVLCVSM